MAEVKVKRLHKLEGEGATKAFADIVVDDELIVTGLRVVSTQDNTLFVSMPQELGKDGKWHDTVFPVKKEVREKISSLVLDAYKS